MGDAPGLRDLFCAESGDRGREGIPMPVASSPLALQVPILSPRAESLEIPMDSFKLSYRSFRLCGACRGEANTINLQSSQVWWRHYC